MVRRSLAVVMLAACGDAGGFPDAAIPDAAPTGTFSLSWSVIDQNSEPLACDRIAAQAMTVLPHHKDFEGGATQIFTCSSGTGMSQAVISGLYELNFELSGTFGLLARAATQFDIEVPVGGNVELDRLVFQVEALGGVALKLASNMAGGNCGATSASGAGIDSFIITLDRAADGTCAPVTLAVSQGATRPAASYTVNCATPAVIPCIEADQVLSATGIASDAYRIHIRGDAGNTCYRNDDTIQVPPLQQTLTRTLNLLATQSSTCAP